MKIVSSFLNRKGIYLVGGFVRDSLLNRETIDVDVAYVGDLEELKNYIKSNFDIRNFREFDKFLSFSFSYNSYEFTITRARREYYNNFRCEPCEIEEDLKRRDFTINAIAYDVVKNKYIDPLNGIQDIKNKVIRRVASFKDDPSRIIRALKFKCKLNFILDCKTKMDLINNLNLLKEKNVRVTKELRELLSCSYNDELLDTLFSYLGCSIKLTNSLKENLNFIDNNCSNSLLKQLL